LSRGDAGRRTRHGRVAATPIARVASPANASRGGCRPGAIRLAARRGFSGDGYGAGRSEGGGRSGDEGARTPDLVNANHALSQLSYIPVRLAKWAYFDSNPG